MKKYSCVIALAYVVLTTWAMSSATPPAHAAPTAPTTTPVAHALDADLIAAVTKGDLDATRDLLARGADPNAKDTSFLKGTALTTASTNYSGNVDIVQALVEAGADLEGQNGEGETPLTLAVMGSHADLIRYLVKVGANLESSSFHETTPLMSAVLLSNPETVRVLIALGANVNARASANLTALFFASGNSVAGNANLEIVKMLVEAGADVSVKTANGKTAQDTAATDNLRDIAEYLYTIAVRDNTLFHATAKIFNERLTSDSNTRSADWQAVKDALANGANPRYSNGETGVTPLMFLAYNLPGADDATVQQIIAHSDLNAQEKQFGFTALHIAADGSNLKMLQWLIKAGADGNVLDNAKQTPLNVALKRSNKSIIDALNQVGTHDNALDVDANGNTKLMLLALEMPFDAARATTLLKAGVDVNAKTAEMYSALMFACDADSPEAVKFLLQNGADVNFIDAVGKTALMYAAQQKSGDDAFNIVQQLISAKADVNAKDKQGNTALSLAREKANIKAADALRNAGAEDVEWG